MSDTQDTNKQDKPKGNSLQIVSNKRKDELRRSVTKTVAENAVAAATQNKIGLDLDSLNNTGLVVTVDGQETFYPFRYNLKSVEMVRLRNRQKACADTSKSEEELAEARDILMDYALSLALDLPEGYIENMPITKKELTVNSWITKLYNTEELLRNSPLLEEMIQNS